MGYAENSVNDEAHAHADLLLLWLLPASASLTLHRGVTRQIPCNRAPFSFLRSPHPKPLSMLRD